MWKNSKIRRGNAQKLENIRIKKTYIFENIVVGGGEDVTNSAVG